MPYRKGLARVMADMKHEWGLWPLMGALAVGAGVLATGIWHNIVKGEGMNWKAGSEEKKKHVAWGHEYWIAKDGKGINRKFYSVSDEYGKLKGGNHDWSAPNFPPERPNIEKMWAEHKKKNLSQE